MTDPDTLTELQKRLDDAEKVMATIHVTETHWESVEGMLAYRDKWKRKDAFDALRREKAARRNREGN